MSWLSSQVVQIEYRARLYKATEAQRQHDFVRHISKPKPFWKRLFRR